MRDTAEFSHIVELSSLPERGKTYALKANELECSKISQRLGTIAVNGLEGSIVVTPQKNGALVTGQLEADLIRECVASLEEMDEHVRDEFILEFDRTVDAAAEDPEHEDFTLEGPEYLEGDILDIGDILVQQLSLAMDPFPRKEGAESLSKIYGKVEESSPFAVLKEAVKSDPQPE